MRTTDIRRSYISLLHSDCGLMERTRKEKAPVLDRGLLIGRGLRLEVEQELATNQRDGIGQAIILAGRDDIETQ